MKCRVAITQQPQLANLPCIIWPWVMRVVGVIDRRALTGEPAVAILEWDSADAEYTTGWQWYLGVEARSAKTLQDLVSTREAVRQEALYPLIPATYGERYARSLW